MDTFELRRATQIIVREHQQLTMVVDGLLSFVHLLGTEKHAPGTGLFRAMLYYIREFPEKIHHPKEDRYLFAHLQERTDTLDDVIDELRLQHVDGETHVLELERALTRFEIEGRPALADLQQQVETYAAFYVAHRKLEEEVILPAAIRYLTKEDWRDIDAAFGANRDPMEGVKAEEDLGRLYAMIVNTIPSADD
ncbi:hemerythrin domain-containing protein [Paraburkholderia adhaesiva]|uniref:hemerythrin domain-containing protein n=1 Tax=Paraburkholderia adhaesiva TaxID=2883244 RepID=UPI001F163D62|nr:hemerythrin domain-containing protein [Paraburkholderia adhaesiva]